MKGFIASLGFVALSSAAAIWEPCGSGAICDGGLTCVKWNDSYSQCVPFNDAGVPPPPTITATVTEPGPTETTTVTTTIGSECTPTPTADNVPVYVDDALESGWQDWSWSSQINYAATDLKQGKTSISVVSEAWAAVSFKGAQLLSTYSGLSIDIAADPSTIQIFFQSSADDTQQTTPISGSELGGLSPGSFTTVKIPFTGFGDATYDRINIQAKGDGASYHVDNILLIKKAPLQYTDVYVDDTLVAGVEDWSWNTVTDYAYTGLADGTSSLKATVEAFGALGLKFSKTLDAWSAVQFDIAANPSQVQVYFQSSTDTSEGTENLILSTVDASINPGAFTTVKIPFTDFKGTSLDRMNFQTLSNQTVVLDNIKLVYDPENPNPTSPEEPPIDPIPVTCPTEGRTKFEYFGVNESGAEFGSGKIPGVLGKDYTWPTTASVDYFLNLGFNTFRIAFLMERLAPLGTGLTGPLDETYLGGLTEIVSYVTSKGGYAVLDPHNYLRYNGTVISSSDFAAFWTTLATVFKDDPKVVFDLQNEPHTIPAAQVFDTMQAGINAVRAAGATSQLILVEGTSWTGAWTWTTTSGNGDVFGAISDPNNNTAIEMHQYLDTDGSGTSATCVSSTVGSERVAAATQWLKGHGLKGFLGEIGAGSNDDCIRAVQGALCDMQQSGVWIGALWWAAGPWWASYFQSIEPPNGASIKRILPEALVPFL